MSLRLLTLNVGAPSPDRAERHLRWLADRASTSNWCWCVTGRAVSAATMVALMLVLYRTRDPMAQAARRSAGAAGGGPLRKNEAYAELACGFGVGTSTVYRYIREGLDLLAVKTPTLEEHPLRILRSVRRNLCFAGPAEERVNVSTLGREHVVSVLRR